MTAATNPPMGLHPYRARITCVVETRSPLHIGSGKFDDTLLPEHEDTQGKKVRPVLACCLRGDGGAFFLPGTTVKNLLRRHTNPEYRDCLYGTVKDTGGGNMGGVFCWGGLCTTVGPVKDAPYAERLKGGGFVAARTAIDDATGTAEDNLLFFQEMVPPGSHFPIELLVVADTADKLMSRTRALLGVLQGLGQGGSIGKGQADGQGRVAIPRDKVRCTVLNLGPDGTFASSTDTKIAPDTKAAADPLTGTAWTLELKCEGPFMVVDSSHEPPGNGAGPQLVAQTLNGDKPLVSGTSIMGVLRSRMEWFEACDSLGEEGCPQNEGEPFIYRTKADFSRMTRVQRLCGVTGYRGLLQARSVEVTAGEKWEITSVKIDRFSGAPFDSGLFCSRTFIGTTITVELFLEDRPGSGGDHCPTHRGDTEFVQSFLNNLKHEGIMLGHGTNKGFGWFTIDIKKETFPVSP